MSLPAPDSPSLAAPGPLAAKIALTYAIFAGTWILFSDGLLAALVADPATLMVLSAMKGWAFVAITSLLLFVGMRRAIGARGMAEALPRAASAPRLLVITATVAAILAASALVALLVYRQEKSEESSRLEFFARLKSIELDSWMLEREADARVFKTSVFLTTLHARWSAGDEAAGSQLRARLGELRDVNHYAGLALARRDGHITLSVGTPLGQSPRLEAAVRRAAESPRVVVEVIPAESGRGQLVLLTTMPDLDGVPGPVAAFTIDAHSALASALGNAPTPRGGELVLFGGPAEGPAMPIYARAWSGEPRVATMLSALAEGYSDYGRIQEAHDPDGKALVAIVHSLAFSGLYLAMLIDRNEAFADAAQQAAWVSMATMLALFAIVAISTLYRQGQTLRREALRQEKRRKRLDALELLDSIVDASPDAIFAKDTEGRYLLFNRESERVTGKSRAEALGRDDRAFFPPADAEMLRANDTRVMAEGRNVSFEENLATAVGPRTYNAVKGPIRSADGTVIGMFGISRDTTERRRMEQGLRDSEALLRASEAHYRSIFSALSEGVIIVSAGGEILSSNASAERILDLEGPSARGAPKDLSTWRPMREDGSPFPLADLPHARVLATGRAQHGIVIGGPLVGGKPQWLLANAEPVLGPGGEVQAVVMSFTDITERVDAQRELASHRERLEELVAERTTQLGSTVAKLESFSYTISHDLRAPLRAINGYASLLLAEIGAELDDGSRRLLGRVIAAADNMNAMLEDIHTYSRADRVELNLTSVNLAGLAREVVEDLRPEYPLSRVEIGELPIVHADPTMMRQAFTNLIGNALKFSSKNASPLVEVGCEGTGSAAEIFVRDNGVGFDMKYAHQLFGIFTRLHRESDFPGTGLGLAIVKHVVERHGGHVRVESVEGKGATFRFSLG